MSDNEEPITYEPMAPPEADSAGGEDAVEAGLGMDDSGDDDLAALLAKRQHARPNRWTWALIGLLVLAIGFTLGALVQQQFGSSGTPTTFTPGQFRPGSPSGSADGGDVAPPQGITVGTVKLVDGENLYVEDQSGATVKVKVPSTASVTASQDVPLSSLDPGTTVIIRGETDADGIITADSVTEGGLPGGMSAPTGTSNGSQRTDGGS